MRDATDNTLDQPALAGVIRDTKEQWIHHGKGTSAHGEDVTQDASNASCCALVGLDGRRMVMRFDTNRHCDPVSCIDHASVFAGANQHLGAFGGEALEVHSRGLIRTVLGPHHRVKRSLKRVRLSTEHRGDLRKLVVSEPEGSVEWLVSRSRGHGVKGSAPPRPSQAATRKRLSIPPSRWPRAKLEVFRNLYRELVR